MMRKTRRRPVLTSVAAVRGRPGGAPSVLLALRQQTSDDGADERRDHERNQGAGAGAEGAQQQRGEGLAQASAASVTHAPS